jgi:hypothetical protein
MLLQALVACAGVTLCAVAAALGIALRGGEILAEGDLDVRGTLAVAKGAPVGGPADPPRRAPAHHRGHDDDGSGLPRPGPGASGTALGQDPTQQGQIISRDQRRHRLAVAGDEDLLAPFGRAHPLRESALRLGQGDGPAEKWP